MRKSRNTRQKELIKNEIEKASSFFTAEELLRKVREKDKKIGIATVYRFLRGFDKKGLCCFVCNRKAVYSRRQGSHCEFACQKCNKISHFNVDSLDFLKNRINVRNICHFQITIQGNCDNCTKK